MKRPIRGRVRALWGVWIVAGIRQSRDPGETLADLRRAGGCGTRRCRRMPRRGLALARRRRARRVRPVVALATVVLPVERLQVADIAAAALRDAPDVIDLAFVPALLPAYYGDRAGDPPSTRPLHGEARALPRKLCTHSPASCSARARFTTSAARRWPFGPQCEPSREKISMTFSWG